MIVAVFLSLSHCALDIFATGKYFNHGGVYGLEIPTIFSFLDLKRLLNSPKNKIIRIEENKIVKHCPKSNLYKHLARKVLYGLLLGVFAIEG